MTVRLEGSGLCGSFIGESGGAFWEVFGFEAFFLGMFWPPELECSCGASSKPSVMKDLLSED